MVSWPKPLKKALKNKLKYPEPSYNRKACLEHLTNTPQMLNPSSVSLQQVADSLHQSPDHKQLDLTTSQGHYVTTLEY